MPQWHSIWGSPFWSLVWGGNAQKVNYPERRKLVNSLWELYVSFFKIGAVTFGGGYAMLPIIQKEIIEKKGWVSNEDVVDYYAVGQCLPGVIAVNTALFIGNKIKGKQGGIAAALGVVTPSVLIITVIAAFIQNFLEYPMVQYAFYGIRVVVCALITQAILKLWKTAVKDVFGLVVYLGALVLALFVKAPTVLLVLLSLAAGLVAHRIQEKKAGENQ